MKCDVVLPLLWDLADGDADALDPRARRDVEEHLSSCAACAKRRDSILETHGFLSRAIPPAHSALPRELPSILPARAEAMSFRSRAPLALAALGLAALSFVALRFLSLPPGTSFLERVSGLPEAVLSAGLPPVPDLGAAARVADAVEPLAGRAREAFGGAALSSRLRGISAAAVAGLLLLQLAGSARLLSPRRGEAA